MPEQLSTHAHTSQIYDKLLTVNKKKTNDSIIRNGWKFLLRKREYSHGPKQHFKRCSTSLVTKETQNPQGATTTYWPKWWSWVPVAEAWRRQWHPTPVLLPGKSHGRRILVGCSPWGREESDTTERLHFHFSFSCIGEENGNLLHLPWESQG